MFDLKTSADNEKIGTYVAIHTNCWEPQNLVRPITDQNIYYMGNFKMVAAVAGEDVAVSEDVNDGDAWILEKDLLV